MATPNQAAQAGYIIYRNGIVNLNTAASQTISNATITSTVLVQTASGERIIIIGTGTDAIEAAAKSKAGVDALMAANVGDANAINKISYSILAGGAATVALGTIGVTAIAPLAIGGILAGRLSEYWWDFSKNFWKDVSEPDFEPLSELEIAELTEKVKRDLSLDPDIHESVKTHNDAAKAALARRRDPLTFDLDGLETSGISDTNPILFDHDGDGVKNGTGWVDADDAFLVLDKNGNGTIDNGLELFGDSTIKSDGTTATDGFDALADLDTNADGVVNADDTQFANLRLWRDLNQDGISQSNELFTLDSQDIVGINVASTAHRQVQRMECAYA